MSEEDDIIEVSVNWNKFDENDYSLPWIGRGVVYYDIVDTNGNSYKCKVRVPVSYLDKEKKTVISDFADDYAVATIEKKLGITVDKWECKWAIREF